MTAHTRTLTRGLLSTVIAAVRAQICLHHTAVVTTLVLLRATAFVPLQYPALCQSNTPPRSIVHLINTAQAGSATRAGIALDLCCELLAVFLVAALALLPAEGSRRLSPSQPELMQGHSATRRENSPAALASTRGTCCHHHAANCDPQQPSGHPRSTRQRGSFPSDRRGGVAPSSQVRSGDQAGVDFVDPLCTR